MFAVGGTDRAQFAGAVQALAKAGKKKLAILYCIESSACTSFHDTVDRDGFAKKFGMQVVYTQQVSLTQTDYTAGCQGAKNAGADPWIFAGDAGGLTRAARSCHTVGFDAPIAIAAVQLSFDRSDANLKRDGIYIASATWPFTQGDNAAQRSYLDAMARYAPGGVIDASGALTWASGKMLERAVAALGHRAIDAPLTAQLVFDGLGSIKNETLGGLIPSTSYSVGQPHSAENFCYGALRFDASGRLSAPQGSRFSCIQ